MAYGRAKGKKFKSARTTVMVDATLRYRKEVTYNRSDIEKMYEEGDLPKDATMRDYFKQEVANQSYISVEAVTINKAGSFIPTKCSVLPGYDAEYMVNGQPMSKHAMLKEIDAGNDPSVIPLNEEQRGTFHPIDLDAPALPLVDVTTAEAGADPLNEI